MVVCAKLIGLYDRDETLLRKTTLDEAPKLFAAGDAVRAGGVARGRPDRVRASSTATRRCSCGWRWPCCWSWRARWRAALALRIAPVERCLFIGDELSAETIRSKLTGHGGVKRRGGRAPRPRQGRAVVDRHASPKPRLAEIRDLAQTLDVHRAIIAPRSVDAGEMLNLVRTLKAVGVRVSVLPRLLEVVGSSVEFDDLHGVTVMGVRRFDLTRSSAALQTRLRPARRLARTARRSRRC